MYRNILIIAFAVLIQACGNKNPTPAGCVSDFISAAEQHDMAKAWDLLSPDAQGFYNDIGDKNRKSGKGILEHDISEVTKFKLNGTDYKISGLPDGNVKISSGTTETVISTVNIGGNYKIKDGNSVRGIIKAIALQSVKKEYYF